MAVEVSHHRIGSLGRVEGATSTDAVAPTQTKEEIKALEAIDPYLNLSYAARTAGKWGLALGALAGDAELAMVDPRWAVAAVAAETVVVATVYAVKEVGPDAVRAVRRGLSHIRRQPNP